MDRDKAVQLGVTGATIITAEPVLHMLPHANGVNALFGLFVGAIVYMALDKNKEHEDEGKPSPSTLALKKQVADTEKKPSFAYRLAVSKTKRAQKELEKNMPSDEAIASHMQQHGMAEKDNSFANLFDQDEYTLSMLMAEGWRPTREEILLARVGSQHIFISLDDRTLEDGTRVQGLGHVALAGSTRRGKTSLIRQLLSQFVHVGADCMLLDPHFTPYDIERDEDWTPFIEKLILPPDVCKEYANIEAILKHAATTILDHRKQLRYQSKPVGEHLFLIIDEYPSIIDERKDVQKYVAKLLREGVKYKIHLVIAAHDFQVKTVSPQLSGASRENYSCCFYVGGDSTTANVLLDKPVPQSEESRLGRGTVYLRAPTCPDASMGRTPYTDNEGIYILVGDSTWEEPDEEMGDEWDGDDNPVLPSFKDLKFAAQESEYAPLPNNAARSTQHAARSTAKTPDFDEENDDAARSSTLPDGWTDKEVELIRTVYPRLKNRDLMLKALGRPHTSEHRVPLTTILKQEGLINE